mmetsp:Transcript_258/g.244  ORF Transcript_258/g.244 Transcript_258/m.244 type:complete len:99 (+) Transcript_258:885-1181(+)
MKEYPDTMGLKLDKNRLIGIYSDKTIAIFNRKTDLDSRIVHIIQNHAKGIHNIMTLPNETSEKGFAFLTGSTDKTLRKWMIMKNGHGRSCTPSNSALL